MSESKPSSAPASPELQRGEKATDGKPARCADATARRGTAAGPRWKAVGVWGQPRQYNLYEGDTYHGQVNSDAAERICERMNAAERAATPPAFPEKPGTAAGPRWTVEADNLDGTPLVMCDGALECECSTRERAERIVAALNAADRHNEYCENCKQVFWEHHPETTACPVGKRSNRGWLTHSKTMKFRGRSLPASGQAASPPAQQYCSTCGGDPNLHDMTCDGIAPPIEHTPTQEREPQAFCDDCGLEYGTDDWLDTVLTREHWLMIEPSSSGILCANCIVRRASRLRGIVALNAYFYFGNDGEIPHDIGERIAAKILTDESQAHELTCLIAGEIRRARDEGHPAPDPPGATTGEGK